MVSARKFTLPKSLASCADLLYNTRQDRLDLQKKVDELQARETLIKDHLIAELPKGEAGGIQGMVARVSIVTKTAPRVTTDTGWDLVHEYILKNDAWELVQRRLNDAAVRERWENGEDIPGIEVSQFATVSMNKV